MPPLGELLRRFRFLGVPGAPASAGVPVDRRAVRAGELAPVLLALQEAEAEAASILARAEQDAAGRRAAGEARARSMVESARARAGEARAEATRARLADAQDRARRMVAEARRAHADIEGRTAVGTPEVVDRVVADVLALGAEPG